MNQVFQKLNFKVGTVLGVTLFIGLTLIAFAAPRKATVSRADGCSPVYDSPIFNPYPVTWNNDPGTSCEDLPVLSGNVQGAGYFSSDFQAQAGETIKMRIYVHNGAASNSGATMHGVSVNTDIQESGDGSTHTLRTTLSADNAASKDGYVTIHTPAGSHLEFVSGDANPYIGDLDACFEFSRAFEFYIRVVGPAVVEGTGNISVDQYGQVGSQCLVGATVNWNTTNLNNVKVYVRDDTDGNEQLFSGDENGNADAPWLTPGHSYTFTLKADGFTDKTATLTAQSLNCGAPTPVNPTVNFTPSIGGQISGQCMRTGNVTWDTTGYESIIITIDDINDDAGATDFSGALSGNEATPWITPGHTYQYVLYDTSAGNRHLVSAKNLTADTLNCGTTPTPVNPTHNLFASIDGQISGQCLRTGNVTWNTTGYDSVLVTIDDLNDQSGAQTFATNTSGNEATPWITPGHTYQYILYNTTNGAKTVLDQKNVTAPALTCGETPVTPPTVQAFNFSINPTTFCANTYPTFSITNATSGLEGKYVYWSSTRNGQSTGENLSYYNDVITNGHWSDVGNGYTLSQVGNWVKTATIYAGPGLTNPVTRNVNFTVTDCTPVTPPSPTNFTATASASATASANISCENGTTATASATASASATVTSSISQQDAQNKAQAQAQINAQAQAHAQAQAKVTCPVVGPSSYTANTSASADGFASLTCPNGTTATATASATASASATSQVSQIDANNKAYAQALANAQAQANASAQAKVVCTSTPPPYVCSANTNYGLTAGTLVKNGSTYSATITWTSTGNHQIKITQINPGSTTENTIATGNNTGSQVVSGLQQGATYIFKMYDNSCITYLTSTQITIPSAPTLLVCSADVSSVNINDDVTFRATGGSAPYLWSTTGISGVSGSSFIVHFASAGTKSASVTSNDGQTANCNVVVNAPVVATGNCNSSTNSCNTNTNTNTGTNTNSTNSSNQNNNSNINGNNNTVTQTNNNCVNNSCNNIVYISTGGTVTPAEKFAQISITKSVRNINGGAYLNSVSANNGENVQFEIIVTNSTGNGNATNVRVTDSLPNGLSLVSGTVTVNGNYVTDNNLFNGMYLGNLSSGQTARINFQARVNASGSSSIQNTASATSDNAGNVQASAWVFVGSVQGGNVNLIYSKSAINETKNANATAVTASREDYIVYALMVINSGNAPANSFVITDDLSQVLPYADIVDFGGGTVSGNTITFPGITVPAGGSVTRNFKIRVKYSLAQNLSYSMVNTYGNTITIRINTPQVLGSFVAPKTGANTAGIAFAGMLTAAVGIFRKRKDIMQLIFT